MEADNPPVKVDQSENAFECPALADFLRLDGLTTIKVVDVNENEIVVTAAGGTRPLRCSNKKCRDPQLVSNGTYEALFRDIPHHRKWTTIYVRRGRTRCKTCGQNDGFEIPAFHPTRNMTKRLVKMIEDNALQRQFTDLGREVGLDESTIRDVAYEHIDWLEANRKVEAPEILGLDEFYIYDKPSAILTNIGEQSVYDVLESRTKDVLKPAIEKILAEKKTRLIVADLYPPYHKMLRRMNTGIPVVADRFHVVRLASYGVAEVRKRVQKSFRDEDDRKLLKKEAHLIESSSLKLHPSAIERRDYWLDRSDWLRAAYEAKERFSAVYDFVDRKDAEEAFDEWRRTLPADVAQYFVQASRSLSDFHEEILAYFDHEYTNAYTESMNRMVKTLNRLGRGYSFKVLRARILFHKPARDKTVKRVPKKVLRSLSGFATPDAIGRMRYEEVIEMVDVEYGPHIPTLTRFLRMSPDYTGPRFEEDEYIDMTPTTFEIEDRERRAAIEIAEIEEEDRNG